MERPCLQVTFCWTGMPRPPQATSLFAVFPYGKRAKLYEGL